MNFKIRSFSGNKVYQFTNKYFKFKNQEQRSKFLFQLTRQIALLNSIQFISIHIQVHQYSIGI